MNTATHTHFEAHTGLLHYMDREPTDAFSQVHKEGDQMSRNGLLMTEALAAAHSAPDTRQDRIDALRARLANGTYEINPLKLAENLVRENAALFTK